MEEPAGELSCAVTCKGLVTAMGLQHCVFNMAMLTLTMHIYSGLHLLPTVLINSVLNLTQAGVI